MYEDEDQQSDIIEGTDEDGNKVLLQVMEYFFYNGEEYVVLGDADECDDAQCACCEHECDHDHESSLYIMKVIASTEENGDEVEEFVPVDEDLMDKLIEVVQTNFSEEEDDAESEDSDEE